jgi:septum formation protein
VLILASRSPQRSAILTQLGVPFAVRPTSVEELMEGDPHAVVLENALRKARAAAGEGGEVLGVDTIVTLEGRIYGKPGDRDEAAATLHALSGATHTVLSAIALLRGAEPQTATAATAVTFRPLDERTLDWYLASEEWRDRAGGYAIQGRGAALVAAIEGDYLNVVGLPVATLLSLWPDLLG